MATRWKRCICLAWLCMIPVSGNATTPMVSLGAQHALALRNDGTVVSWGSDESGQLGAGRLPYETRPGMVAGLTGVRSIASGVNHSLAVRADGTVWTWGNNYDGQLGDGSTINSSEPTQVRGLVEVVQACGGDGYSLALRRDGSVWAWGGNYYGTLADGTQENSLLPRQVLDLSSVNKVVCGSTHALALRSDGRVWAWGSNAEGALRKGLDAVEVLRAAFPAGTVSGAPKVRAMEIIDELEPERRGIYAGAVGYLGFDGNMDLAIAIRTAVVKDGLLHVQAGAGIVADSDPDSEWRETQSKARAILRAAEIASQGLEQASLAAVEV